MILDTCKKVLQTHWLLTAGMILSIVGSIVLAVLPPVILARIVDTLSLSNAISVSVMILYFFLFLFENVCISIRDSLLVLAIFRLNIQTLSLIHISEPTRPY